MLTQFSSFRLNERRDYKRAWPGQEAAVYVKMADNGA